MTMGFGLKRRILVWMVARSNVGRRGKVCAWLASLSRPGYKRKTDLADLHESGYTSHSAQVVDARLQKGKHVYLGDRVVVYSTGSGGPVELGDRVMLYSDIVIETTHDGEVHIGEASHVQPRCHFVAAVKGVRIGKRCEIAPACAFYPFNHKMAPDVPVRDQGLCSAGGIEIGDDVWLGYGVVVLQNVRIGNGAVIGANSLVTRDIPANAIAFGSPASVVRQR